LNFLIRILIAGGGYAGLQTVLLLDRLLKGIKSNIVLIDKRAYHTLLPSLPEIISKRGFSIINYKDILKNRNIEFTQADIRDINLENKTISIAKNLQISRVLDYDFLVLSLGSQPFVPSIAGMKEHAFLFNSIEDAQKIAVALTNVGMGKTVVIGGGGATGVEIAGEIATVLRSDYFKSNRAKIVLVSSNLLIGFPNDAVKWAKIYLDSLNVQLLVGKAYSIVEIRPDSIRLIDGSEIKSSLFIWTGGVVSSPILKQIGLKTSYKGRVIVNNYLQPEGKNDVFVIGDSALILDRHGQPLPTTAFFAKEHGKVAAYNIYAKIIGKPMREYKPGDSGSSYAISIGSDFGISKISGLDLFGYSASKLKKMIKMKYLKEIGGSSLAGKEYSRF
jgi:NADH:quinone reductase (non-electrogenic)